MTKVVSKYHPLKHYLWGDNCDGWNLVEEKELSVKQERMPPATAEVMHYHKKAQQFFYILKGTATFEIEGSLFEVAAGQGLHIEAGKKHRVTNQTLDDLEFILCAHPATASDRINCTNHE